MTTKRVAIFIDGSNFFHKLKGLGLVNLTKFNYKGLVDSLVSDGSISYYGYYVGVVRAKEGDARGQVLRRSQQRSFAHLESQGQCFIIKRGTVMENGGVYHEKGVDVGLAVDLLVGAYENNYDKALVVSSDTDLVPAIRKVVALKKEIEYVGFAHLPSLGMQKYATRSRLLILEDLKKFEAPSLVV